jgi:hypothetical protein
MTESYFQEEENGDLDYHRQPCSFQQKFVPIYFTFLTSLHHRY